MSAIALKLDIDPPKTAPQVIDRLIRDGFTMKVIDGKVSVKPPPTAEQQDWIVRHKPEIIAMLGEYPEIYCWECGRHLPDGQPSGQGPLYLRGLDRFICLGAACLSVYGLRYDQTTGTTVRL